MDKFAEIVKVCEIVVPDNKLLNDNINNSYKSNMGKMKWLEDQAKMGVRGEYGENPKCMCWINDKWLLPVDFNPDSFALIVNHFKCKSQKFDFANYERTVKPVIDVLTANGYFKDDDHYHLNPIIFSGGDVKNWRENNVFKLKDEIYECDKLEDYFEKVVPKWCLERTKYKKLSNYDIFQIYCF